MVFYITFDSIPPKFRPILITLGKHHFTIESPNKLKRSNSGEEGVWSDDENLYCRNGKSPSRI